LVVADTHRDAAHFCAGKFDRALRFWSFATARF
jgi:hypothetical protein